MKGREQNERDVSGSPVNESMFWLRFEAGFTKWGTVFLFLFTVAGLSGLFSHGYFSDVSVANRDNTLSVDYERFGRVISDMDMKIHLRAGNSPVSTLTLEGDFMERFDITTLEPEPARRYSEGGKLILEYPANEKHAEQSIWLGLHPRSADMGYTRLSLNGGEPVTFFQLIYP